jgi:hypothetical protein
MSQENSRSDSRPRLSGPAKGGRVLPVLASVVSMGRAILREIFDESAYQRFLDRSQLESSAKSYAVFLQENEQARSRRPRCC